MNPDLMTVLSMRQKEVAYLPLVSVAPYRTSRSLAERNSFAAGSSSLRAGPLDASSAAWKPSAAHHLDRAMVYALDYCPQEAVLMGPQHLGLAWNVIVELCSHFALQRQTAHYAIQFAKKVTYVDATAGAAGGLGAGAPPSLDAALLRELKEMATTCVFMAAKVEEIHPPKVAELIEFVQAHEGVGALSVDELLATESAYLKVCVLCKPVVLLSR